ncbi:MAG TPA: two-component regulator propeller domain-containing protein, partial [Prolixibacteraceae bacterium]|nr:two-component regulator propeller domain-containing protein [Prolixibacteraceae bacterium]
MRQIIFLAVLFLLSRVSFSADEFVHFNTNNEKLNHNTVNAVYHDKLGYVWVATNNGLNKLDAHQTTIYQHLKTDSTKVSANFINTVFVDSDNDLWIGTLGGGVNIFNREKNEFIMLSQNTEHFNSKNITAFSQDKLGNIWIGTEGNGVYKYNKTSGQIKNFDLEKHDPAKRTNSNVNVIFCDNEGDIWIGMTKAEVFMIDPQTDQISYHGLLREQAGFKQVGSIMGIGQLADSTVLFATWNSNLFELNKQQHTQIQLRHTPAFFNYASLTDLAIDNDNNIWLGTWENGLFKLCPSSSQLCYFVYDANKPGSIVSNAINSLHFDKQNNKLWIGTTNNGLSMLSLQPKMFSTLNADISSENAINVYSIIKDQNENLWIGTRGNGLWMVNPTTGETRNYLSEQHNGLNSNSILTLKMSTDGIIWIGTDGSFVSFFDPKNQKFTQVPFGTDWSQAVFAIEESPNYIWAGTWGGGIKKIDKKTLQYTSINFDADDQYRNTVFDLAMKDSILWIADIGIGLIRYNTASNTTKKYSQTEGCKNCPSERILDIFVQSDTLLYLGTDGDGLHAFNIFTETFRRIDYQQNETSNVVQAIVTDNNENLWIASTFGLTSLNQEQKTLHYFKHNGLSNNQLNKGA